MNATSRRLAACGLALSAIVLPVGAAPARADAVTWESDWSFRMRSGKFDRLGAMLTAEAAKELAAAPKQLFAAARSAAVYLPRGLQRGATEQLVVARWFADIGAALQASELRDASAARALAAVAGFTCRSAAAIGSGAGLADAQAVAEHTMAFYGRSSASDGGAALADALGWIRAALSIPEVEPGPVLAVQQELFTRLSSTAVGPALAVAKAELELGKALAAPDIPSARSAIERCLAALKPLVSASPPPPEPSSLVNEALDLASQRKLGVRGDFVTEEKVSGDGRLRVALAIGTGWRADDPSNDRPIALSRYGTGGVRLYNFAVFAHDTKGTYKSPVTGDTAVGSDLKGLAAQRSDVDAAELATVSRKREPKPMSVGRGFAPGFYTEVTGTGPDGKPRTYRAWLVKGKLNPKTYTIVVIDYTGSEATPGDLQAVVDSFAEVKPGR